MITYKACRSLDGIVAAIRIARWFDGFTGGEGLPLRPYRLFTTPIPATAGGGGRWRATPSRLGARYPWQYGILGYCCVLQNPFSSLERSGKTRLQPAGGRLAGRRKKCCLSPLVALLTRHTLFNHRNVTIMAAHIAQEQGAQQ